MKKIERVSLIGLGAVGSANLAKIAQTIPIQNISVIASGARAEKYREKGVCVNGDFFYFPVSDPCAETEPSDLLIFAVKNNQLIQAIADTKKHVGKDTIILSLLNGVTSELEIAKEYGMEKILYSYVMGTDATRTGNSTVYKNLGYIPFGESTNTPGCHSDKVLSVEEFFKRVGISYMIPENMIKDLWLKFMLNVGANQISAILRCPYGAIQQNNEVRKLVVTAMKEAMEVSRAENIDLGPDDIAKCLSILDKLSPKGKTSMLQDVEAGRQTEVDVFGGVVSALGKKHDIPVPLNDALVPLIKALEETSDTMKY
jgi:2-dehydropantoate 2-reductase